MHFISPSDRHQSVMFGSLDELIPVHHYVRIIDTLVDSIVNINPETYTNKGLENVGRKAYHPSVLLKLYIYGYLNSLSSSRKLEIECTRNIELKWLLGNLIPDHKTIANYRKENSSQIKQVLQQFNLFLKEKGFIKGETVSIDGTKIRANAAQAISLDYILPKLKELYSQCENYMEQLDKNDKHDEAAEVVQNLEKEQEEMLLKINKLKDQIQTLEKQKQQLEELNRNNCSPVDTDARVMKSKEGFHFSYNIQTVVDKQHKFIADTKVYTQANDKGLLTPMIESLENSLNIKPVEVIADAGYSSLPEIEEIEKQKNIKCFVAINLNQHQAKDKLLDIHFTYNDKQDAYTCSKGEKLILKRKNKIDNNRGTLADIYEGVNCQNCAIKTQCTKGYKARLIYRYHNNEWKESYISRMKSETGRQKMRLRKTLSEHPFATLKRWMGKIPLKLRGKTKVETEINIYTIAYNLKRLINLQLTQLSVEQIKNHNWSVAV